MTVKELIEHLEKLPQAHMVVVWTGSDMLELDEDQIKVERGVRHHNLPDTVRTYKEYEWCKPMLVWVCPECKKWMKSVKSPRRNSVCFHLSPLEQRLAEPDFVDVVELGG